MNPLCFKKQNNIWNFPNKDKVFTETYRILKEDGEMYLSDIVLLEELTKEQKMMKTYSLAA